MFRLERVKKAVTICYTFSGVFFILTCFSIRGAQLFFDEYCDDPKATAIFLIYISLSLFSFILGILLNLINKDVKEALNNHIMYEHD